MAPSAIVRCDRVKKRRAQSDSIFDVSSVFHDSPPFSMSTLTTLTSTTQTPTVLPQTPVSQSTGQASGSPQNTQWGPQGIATVVFGCVSSVLALLGILLIIWLARRRSRIPSTDLRTKSPSREGIAQVGLGDSIIRRVGAGNTSGGEERAVKIMLWERQYVRERQYSWRRKLPTEDSSGLP